MGLVLGDFLSLFRAEAAALGAAITWAVSTLAFGHAVRHVGPMILNVLKGMVGLAIMVAVLGVTGELLDWPGWRVMWLLLLSGAIGIGIGDTALFDSFKQLGPRKAVLLSTIWPFMALILAYMFLDESISGYALLGMCVTIGGVGWVILERQPAGKGHKGHAVRGVVMGLIAALGQAIGFVIVRDPEIKDVVSPMYSVAPRIVGGLAILIPYLMLRKQSTHHRLLMKRPLRLWGVILVASFLGTFIGLWLQQVANLDKHGHAGVVSTLIATTPIWILPMVALTGERVSLRAVLGAFIATAGVAIMVMDKEEAKKKVGDIELREFYCVMEVSGMVKSTRSIPGPP